MDNGQLLLRGATKRMRHRRGRDGGFTLLELMTVVAIIGLLSTLAVPTYTRQVAKAKRTEVTNAFGNLWESQKAFYLENGHYADNFDQLTFDMEGLGRLSSTAIQGRLYTYVISQPWGPKSFYCVATGNIDSDLFPDVAVLEIGRTE